MDEIAVPESARLDPALVEALVAQRCALPGARCAIRFHTPSFKSYASSEIAACAKHAWPAVSITGPDCRLQCDHCHGKVLGPMTAARTPEALWRVANEAIARGAEGMLLTGGSNTRNEVEYGPFLATVRRIKDAWPAFGMALHAALVDRDMARRIEAAGVDTAMLDLIGAQDTVAQVYHLRRPVADFERSLEHLARTAMRVVPHIVLGLHYGRMLGEWAALDMVVRHRPSALVLVVAMPVYASAQRPFATLPTEQIGRFFLDARRALPETPLLLGCARPAGRDKLDIDAYAVLAGFEAIAHPAEGIVEFALALGAQVRVSASCCAMAAGDAAAAGVDESGLRLDAALLAASRRAPTTRRSVKIPVVSA